MKDKQTVFHYLPQDSIIALAEAAGRNSIYIYESWEDEYRGKTPDQIREHILGDFPDFPSGEGEVYLDTRVKEILRAMDETPRRLSVSYTNLGIVYRYHEDYKNAAACYTRAIELWEDNLTAENNLNILLDRPMKKRSLLRKLFPKPKE